MVLNGSKKIGEIPIVVENVEDFKNHIESHALMQIHHKGRPLTWWNGRAHNDNIFEKLDRFLANREFHDAFSQIKVEHLPRFVSDHAHFLRYENSVSSVKNLLNF